MFFWIKLIGRLILKREISGSHTISDQSLLLSTIILNDISYIQKCKGVGTGPAGPVLAGPLFNSLAYMVKQNCMFEKSRQ